MHQFPPISVTWWLAAVPWSTWQGYLYIQADRYEEKENWRTCFKWSVWGTVSSFCAKTPCFSPPTNIHLSEQVFLQCYDKCVCIMKVGVKWPHSDSCVAFISCLFEFRLFLSSLSPCRARRCVPQHLCVWWMKLGHFFSGPAFLISERINTALYKMVAGDPWFHSLSQHLFLWPGVAPRSDWCLYHLLSSRRASLHCQARVCLDKFGQRRISLWCVLFHAMFVFLSVCAQAHSLHSVVY